MCIGATCAALIAVSVACASPSGSEQLEASELHACMHVHVHTSQLASVQPSWHVLHVQSGRDLTWPVAAPWPVQASSPDEEALVTGAAFLGYRLYQRSTQHVTVEMLRNGEMLQYEVRPPSMHRAAWRCMPCWAGLIRHDLVGRHAAGSTTWRIPHSLPLSRLSAKNERRAVLAAADR